MLGMKVVSSTIAASALALVFTALSPASQAEANPALRQCQYRIWAVAVQRGPMPFGFKAWIARRKAIRQWRRKTVSRFGRDFRRWRMARAKNVTCEGGNGRVVCEVSAKPCSPFRLTDAFRYRFEGPYRPGRPVHRHRIAY